MIASTVWDYAYKHESNANVRERILLVRRIMSDGQDIGMVSKELHRSIAWAYKWLIGYSELLQELLSSEGGQRDNQKDTVSGSFI